MITGCVLWLFRLGVSAFRKNWEASEPLVPPLSALLCLWDSCNQADLFPDSGKDGSPPV